MRFALAVLLCTGCWGAMVEAQDPSTALEKCRNEARAAYFDGGSVERSLDIYERCKAREGVL